MRPFNHFGPGQSEAFVVPAFAMQIARIEAGLSPPVIRVGNLDAQRDFLDVRDVARAYALAVHAAERLGSGTILNIASGMPRQIADVLSGSDRDQPHDDCGRAGSGAAAGERAAHDDRQCRPRPSLLQWQPEYSFDATLAAVLDDCRARVVVHKQRVSERERRRSPFFPPISRWAANGDCARAVRTQNGTMRKAMVKMSIN